MIDPSVSVPSAKPTSPAAVDAAEPALDPLDVCSVFHGVFVMPLNHSPPCASAPMESLAMSTAPALLIAKLSMGDEHRARVAQAFHHRRVLLRYAGLVRLRAERGQNAFGVEQVLQPERNSVQRTAIVPRLDLLVRCRRLL